MSFLIGQIVKVETTFRNEKKELFNPHTVTIKIKNAKGVEFALSVINTSPGVFSGQVRLNAGGTWWYRTDGLDVEGNEIAADEGPIEVARSQFSSP